MKTPSKEAGQRRGKTEKWEKVSGYTDYLHQTVTGREWLPTNQSSTSVEIPEEG